MEYDNHTMTLCCLAALNVWYKVEESGKRLESFTKIYKDQNMPILTLLQRLTSAVNKIVSDSQVRQILIEFLAFEMLIQRWVVLAHISNPSSQEAEAGGSVSLKPA